MNKVVAWRYVYGVDVEPNAWVSGEPEILDYTDLFDGEPIELAYAIPDTHCVVPRELTKAMIDKMVAAYGADIYSAESLSKTNKEIVRSPMRSAYEAMLNAAEVGDGG